MYKIYLHNNMLFIITKKRIFQDKETVKKQKFNFVENVAEEIGSIDHLCFNGDMLLIKNKYNRDDIINIPSGFYEIKKSIIVNDKHNVHRAGPGSRWGGIRQYWEKESKDKKGGKK